MEELVGFTAILVLMFAFEPKKEFRNKSKVVFSLLSLSFFTFANAEMKKEEFDFSKATEQKVPSFLVKDGFDFSKPEEGSGIKCGCEIPGSLASLDDKKKVNLPKE